MKGHTDRQYEAELVHVRDLLAAMGGKVEGMIQDAVQALVDHDAARAASVADGLSARFGAGRAIVGSDRDAAVAAAEGIINATPLGMEAHPGMALPASLLRPDLWVAEVVYFPLETELLRSARALGCRTVDGGGMAVFQAVEAFRLFSGVTPDAERMRQHFASMG